MALLLAAPSPSEARAAEGLRASRAQTVQHETVLISRPSGEDPGPIAELELSDLDGVIGFKLNGEVVGDQSGLPVSRAGDLNGDGFDDLVVSAAMADPNGDRSGRVYVVFGRAPGDPFPAELELSSLDGVNGFMVNGEAVGDRAGVAVSAAGDINGDGLDDLLIGAYLVSLPGPLPLIGRSYVVFGRAPVNPFPAELELSGLDGTNGFKIRGEALGDRSGFAVSAGGDINGDGRDDLLIGAITADPNGRTDAGRGYVVFGREPEDPFPAELVLSTLDGAIGFKINGEAAGNEAGHAVRAAGDVNGDGVGDVVLGARFAAPNGTNSGRSYVVFGRAPGTPFPAEIELSDLDGATGFKLNGEMAHDHSGWDVSAAGDVNGDGVDDVIVGALVADPNGLVDAGRSYVVLGRAPGDPFPAEIELADLDGTIGFKLNGEAAGDQSGVSLSIAGDFNDDGRLDLIIGAHTASPNGLFSAGRTYIVFGRDPANPFPAELELSELNGLYGFKINGESAISSSGRAVDGAGDINGDGVADLLIGAWATAPNGNLSGRSYVVFGQPPPSGPVLVISPDSLDFGPQQVGTTSSVSSVTLGNVGTADVHVGDVATPPPPFAAAGGSCGITPFVIAPGTVCTLSYTFSPTAVGSVDAVVEVVSDAPSSPDGFGLAGEGVQGALTIAPDLVEFGPHPVGTTSGALSVTLENTGTADVHVDSISPAPAPFASAAGTCDPPPFLVTPGAACTLDYVFSPTTIGSFDAVVEVVSDAPSSPDSFGLAGEGVPPPPQIQVDPDSLEVTLPRDDVTTEILTITNGGGEELEWEVVEQPDLSGLAAFGDLTTITHSASMDIAPDNNLGCSVDGGASTLDTQFLRTFALDDFDIAHDFEIVEVVFGVQTATAATTVVLNLYTLEGEFTYPNLTLVGSATVDVPITDLSLQTVPISATVPAGATFVVEIAAPDLNGVSAFVAGSNALGETAPSYFASTSCGLAQPVPYGSIGLPQVHLVMAVSGIVQTPPNCERPGWLAADPLAGVVAPGGSLPMDVTFDASGLTPGDYEATLCLSSNDPERPLTTVPLALTVTEAEVAELAFDPTSLDFGEVEVGSTSLPQTATLQNTGSGDATGLAFGPTGDGFEADTSACGDTLSAGASCEVSVTFSPGEPGEAGATLQVDSDEGASAAAELSGNGVGDGGFTPMALQVDHGELVSDRNGVFEPGERVVVTPSWHNDGTLAQSLVGTATDFTGPEGPDYAIVVADANYGEIEPGATASCQETGLCYEMEIGPEGAERPAPHWDAQFTETLSDAEETTQPWTLHVGASFTDVPPTDTFYPSIETLLHSGVTSGCGGDEYCPGDANSRAQMPVFMLRALMGPDYAPPACVEGEEVFGDVLFDDTFCPWIQDLANRGIVAGCGDGNYCPASAVSRAQMSIFLLKTIEGDGYEPSTCTGQFTDVPCPSLFADWIEDLAARGITGGCTATTYCPGDAVSRAQMAVFITKAFGFTLYGP